MSSLPVAMTIAGSDSGGGAGIQADLKTFQAFHIYGTSALTAITCQNSCTVSAIQAVHTEIVAGQIAAIMEDFPVAAIKTGMLFSAEIITAIEERLKESLSRYTMKIPIVVDPVMVAASGDRLLESSAEEALRQFLPLASLITPNLPEAELLCGDTIGSLSEMEAAAVEMARKFHTDVLLKGGHARQQNSTEIIDILYERKEGKAELFSYPRLNTKNTHGTGCTLSAAITAGLAKGEPLQEAVFKGRRYLQRAMESAPSLGKGHGPLNHFTPSSALTCSSQGGNMTPDLETIT